MDLAHPCQLRSFIYFHCVSPESFQYTPFDFAQFAGIEALARIDQVVDFPLVGRLQQMRDEIVEIGVGKHLRQSEALHARIRALARQ
ncbi:hypothetical protein D3C74_476780 [compost metagenome]